MDGAGDVKFSKLPVSTSLAQDSIDLKYKHKVESEISNQAISGFFVKNFRCCSESDCSREFL